MTLTLLELEILLQQEEGRHFNTLVLPEVREFLILSLNEYGTKDKLDEANEVTDVMVGMLKKMKQINAQGSQTFVEIMIAGALLHNLFYDGTVSSLFKARELLLPIAKEAGLPDNGSDGIFQAIEAQLGYDTPVSACKPNPGTPPEIFAWAVWFVKEYKEHPFRCSCGSTEYSSRMGGYLCDDCGKVTPYK